MKSGTQPYGVCTCELSGLVDDRTLPASTQHHHLHRFCSSTQQLLQTPSSRAHTRTNVLLLISEIIAVIAGNRGFGSRCSRHAESRASHKFVWRASQALLTRSACIWRVRQAGSGAAGDCSAAMADQGATLRIERVTGAVELAEVACCFATGAMSQFGPPLARFCRGSPSIHAQFSRLPLGGVKI